MLDELMFCQTAVQQLSNIIEECRLCKRSHGAPTAHCSNELVDEDKAHLGWPQEKHWSLLAKLCDLQMGQLQSPAMDQQGSTGSPSDASVSDSCPLW